MADSDLKRKMISIRLSEDEYKTLKSRYGTYGARSISDLARLALQRILNAAAPEEQIARELAKLGGRVQELESQVASILARQLAGG